MRLTMRGTRTVLQIPMALGNRIRAQPQVDIPVSTCLRLVLAPLNKLTAIRLRRSRRRRSSRPTRVAAVRPRRHRRSKPLP